MFSHLDSYLCIDEYKLVLQNTNISLKYIQNKVLHKSTKIYNYLIISVQGLRDGVSLGVEFVCLHTYSVGL